MAKNDIKKIGNEKIPLYQAIRSEVPISDQKIISDVFLKIYGSQRSMENAYYLAKICTEDGTEIKPFKISHKYKSKKQDKVREVNEIVLSKQELVDFMSLIQGKEIGYFSSIKMYAQERSIEYHGNNSPQNYYRFHSYYGPPSGITPIKGPHYFLDLILGIPGKKVKLTKTMPVKACKSCNTMLLRYTYDWVVQCDDLNEKICPYCEKPLKIIQRERKYVEVDLDFDAKDCKITGTNNQIGILYQGRPIKTTVKVAALRNFLMNFQNLFPSKVIGPLDLSIDIMKSRKCFNYINSVVPSTLAGEIEWRPVVLFPEDLIAF
ncbi:MAG: hypothetical protein EU532_01635 [Promethearchaeota archaeon]|nr:MAG: hypothetical protein EU532_01635 [Candidatus Lokiarchaeota archaeon]